MLLKILGTITTTDMTTTDKIIERVMGFKEWCAKSKERFLQANKNKNDKTRTDTGTPKLHS